MPPPRPLPLLVALAVWLTAGCGLTTAVRPVPKGAVQVEAALGGPFFGNLGVALPLPLSSAGVRYGVADGLDVSGHAHLTSLTFGVAGLDAGATWMPLAQEGARPALTLGARLYGFASVLGARGAPPFALLELSPTLSWQVAPALLPYLSGTLAAQVGGPLLGSAALGAEVPLGAWGLQAEARWYQPGLPSQNMAVDWKGLGGLGGLGVVLGARYRFGGTEGL
jgi:hypothetical protein